MEAKDVAISLGRRELYSLESVKIECLKEFLKRMWLKRKINTQERVGFVGYRG